MNLNQLEALSNQRGLFENRDSYEETVGTRLAGFIQNAIEGIDETSYNTVNLASRFKVLEFASGRGNCRFIELPIGKQNDREQNYLTIGLGQGLGFMFLQRYNTRRWDNKSTEQAIEHKVVIEVVALVKAQYGEIWSSLYNTVNADHIHVPEYGGGHTTYTHHEQDAISQLENAQPPFNPLAVFELLGLKKDTRGLSGIFQLNPTSQRNGVKNMLSTIVRLDRS